MKEDQEEDPEFLGLDQLMKINFFKVKFNKFIYYF